MYYVQRPYDCTNHLQMICKYNQEGIIARRRFDGDNIRPFLYAFNSYDIFFLAAGNRFCNGIIYNVYNILVVILVNVLWAVKYKKCNLNLQITL